MNLHVLPTVNHFAHFHVTPPFTPAKKSSNEVYILQIPSPPPKIGSLRPDTAATAVCDVFPLFVFFYPP